MLATEHEAHPDRDRGDRLRDIGGTGGDLTGRDTREGGKTLFPDATERWQVKPGASIETEEPGAERLECVGEPGSSSGLVVAPGGGGASRVRGGCRRGAKGGVRRVAWSMGGWWPPLLTLLNTSFARAVPPLGGEGGVAPLVAGDSGALLGGDHTHAAGMEVGRESVAERSVDVSADERDGGGQRRDGQFARDAEPRAGSGGRASGTHNRRGRGASRRRCTARSRREREVRQCEGKSGSRPSGHDVIPGEGTSGFPPLGGDDDPAGSGEVIERKLRDSPTKPFVTRPALSPLASSLGSDPYVAGSADLSSCGACDDGGLSRDGSGASLLEYQTLLGLGEAPFRVLRAALVSWRDRRRRARLTSIESGWTGQRAVRLGRLDSHVRFLQWVFRATRGVRSGCWQAGGGLRLALSVALSFGRHRRETKCAGGSNLAQESEFSAQRALADECLGWYSTYVSLLRRLQSGVTPFSLQAFCGAGGSSEGCRRAGGASVGADLYEQPDYVRRFGSEAFDIGDCVDWSFLARLKARHRAKVLIGGPPCKFYSQLRRKGEATQPPLISQFRAACVGLFSDDAWAIENVMGASRYMSEGAAEIDGALFGLRVLRSRLYESNFGVHVDECLAAPARRLRDRCCLGSRRRFRAFDEFGRPEKRSCCGGNIFSVVGRRPFRCTFEECASAMGFDYGHCDYERMAQAVPPQYGQLVFAQACGRLAQKQFGAPFITFDEMRARPSWARRTMALWLRGAGEPSPAAGMLFEPEPPPRSAQKVSNAKGGAAASIASLSPADYDYDYAWFQSASRASIREISYSHAGGFDLQWCPSELRHRLEEVQKLEGKSSLPSAREMRGRNTFIEVAPCDLSAALPLLRSLLGEADVGTAVTVVAPSALQGVIESAGLRPLPCIVKGIDIRSSGLSVWYGGRRRGASARRHLDHATVRPFMDEKDSRGWKVDPAVKAKLTWEPMPHDPGRYRGKGLKPEIERMMTEGVRIDASSDLGAFEVAQYSWPTGEGLIEAINEVNRAICVGAMEYVPDADVKEVLESGIVHPLTIVSQGEGKWRACHDYSVGTNRVAGSAPFGLPTPWSVRPLLRASSFMKKYDLRDGFWACPVHPQSRKHLCVRHPATGRLVRCCRLPFGFIDSPRLFCGLTEGVAEIFRRRAADMATAEARECGMHVLVFVDDFLVVGDDERLTERAGELLELILDELGLQYAPHKKRGPAQVMEFLGLLISNAKGARCIALTEKRQSKLLTMLGEWRDRRPEREGLSVDPTELARLLGNLVFASQVVPGGRTYMQGMLSQFQGLEVDWRRGSVRQTRVAGAAWRTHGVELSDSFWRDIDWWLANLETRNCVSLEPRREGVAAICGTDASDWGTGQLLWNHGARAEVSLEFTDAERQRSINWRELLGIVRVVMTYGEELRGRSVLIEGDNTASLAAAESMSSKAFDSQELVRRLVELIEEFDLEVRYTHTPGVKLDRPDQTSRGDPIEEPRVRLTRSDYALLERRFGPFTEWCGAERSHVTGGGLTSRGADARVWMHPAFNTVGSALRRLGERMADSEGEALSGIVVVPHDESAGWWPLTKHFSVVGRRWAGSNVEISRWGRWESAVSRRDAIILAFPRAAGASIEPMLWGRPGQAPSSYCRAVEAPAGDDRVYLPAPVGSFWYGPSLVPYRRGTLYMVWSAFDPGSEGTIEYDGDEPTVSCAEMLLGSRDNASGEALFALDRRGPPHGSFANGGCGPWAVNPSLLFSVSHLVRASQVWDGVSETGTGRVKWGSVKGVTFSFDWRAADREIARRVGSEDTSSTGQAGMQRELAAHGDEADATQALNEAVVSAEEAAAARTRPTPHTVPRPVAKPLPPPRSITRFPCRYSHMRCEGCDNLIGFGKLCRPGGRGVVHDDDSCLARAEQKLADGAGGKDLQSEGAVSAGSARRGAEASHRLSDERKHRVMLCLDGKCGVGHADRIMCKEGCGRGLHALECGMLSKGVRDLGNLTCAYCRGQKLLVGGGGDVPPSVVNASIGSMIIEMSTGASSTYSGYSDLVTLERRWQSHVGGEAIPAAQVRLPHTSQEATLSFLEWLAGEGGRARSLGSVVVMLSSYCSKLEIDDVTRGKRVVRMLKDLQTKGQACTAPCTAITPALNAIMINETIELTCSKVKEMREFYVARERWLQTMEFVGGTRVGEACGDVHGMLANNVCIQKAYGPGAELGETIEMKIEDSKVKLGRFVVFAGTTLGSGIKCADILRDYWKQAGIETDEAMEGGFLTIRPDFYVVRVSLLDMGTGAFATFLGALREEGSLDLSRNRASNDKYAKARRSSSTLGEEARYVNVASGRKESVAICATVAVLNARGLGRYVDVIPGPLVLSTLGHKVVPMPYSPGSTHVHLVPAMKLAFEKMKASEVVDVWFDLLGLSEPKFDDHSNRRGSDRVAMHYAEQNGASGTDLDFYYGWNLKKMSQDMKLHYAGLDRRSRLLRLAKLTSQV